MAFLNQLFQTNRRSSRSKCHWLKDTWGLWGLGLICPQEEKHPYEMTLGHTCLKQILNNVLKIHLNLRKILIGTNQLYSSSCLKQT